LGASVAVVYGKKKRNLRISLRSSSEFVKKTGIHLGKDVAQPLGEYVNGVGGGHRTAAGVDGVAREFNQIFEKCLSLLKRKITKD